MRMCLWVNKGESVWSLECVFTIMLSGELRFGKKMVDIEMPTFCIKVLDVESLKFGIKVKYAESLYTLASKVRCWKTKVWH